MMYPLNRILGQLLYFEHVTIFLYRISHQKYPIFDAVVRISDKEVGPMPSPEKKFILVALPAENGSSHCKFLAHKCDNL